MILTYAELGEPPAQDNRRYKTQPRFLELNQTQLGSLMSAVGLNPSPEHRFAPRFQSEPHGPRITFPLLSFQLGQESAQSLVSFCFILGTLCPSLPQGHCQHPRGALYGCHFGKRVVIWVPSPQSSSHQGIKWRGETSTAKYPSNPSPGKACLLDFSLYNEGG